MNKKREKSCAHLCVHVSVFVCMSGGQVCVCVCISVCGRETDGCQLASGRENKLGL